MGKVVEIKNNDRKYLVFGDGAIPLSAYRIMTAKEFFGPINEIIEMEEDGLSLNLEIIDGAYYLNSPIYFIEECETGVYGVNNSAVGFSNVELALSVIRSHVKMHWLLDVSITGLEGKVNG